MRLGRKLAEGFAADPVADRAERIAPPADTEPAVRENTHAVAEPVTEPAPVERHAGV
ncbi:hypothetical protein ACVGVM_09325 [Pseudonocardia bannensis]|uniref:Uncharacterized protein n=1 Tax=Pseudonocardia bannensis TaxID=630973 RepID=A0A848DCL7_9PSEU|nr:hypothetical protein [Pseudonocardia bannensis]NMH90335.1 hypothetical protein [Pseudonocardia bannensis]